jgi:hypothetical protein
MSFTTLAFATEIKSQIHSFDKGKVGQPHLIKLMDGQVVFINFDEKSLIEEIENSQKRGDWIALTVDAQNTMLSYRIIPAPSYALTLKPSLQDFGEDYSPSVVSSSKASAMFKKMRKSYQKESQCYNRAHIWTYEEYMRSGTNLNKVFMFFTNRYIRKYRFHWWFHVTPMTYVGGSQFKNWKMLDRRYTKGPLGPKAWSDIFIRSKRSCKVIYKFMDYRENQESQHCYFLPVSQFYLVPSDIEFRDSEGVYKTEYDAVEVEHALWEAFK